MLGNNTATISSCDLQTEQFQKLSIEKVGPCTSNPAQFWQMIFQLNCKTTYSWHLKLVLWIA